MIQVRYDFLFFRDEIYRSKCTINDSATCLLTADFTEPLSVPGSSTTESVDEDAVAMICCMGFTKSQAIKALKATVSNILQLCMEFWRIELNSFRFVVRNPSKSPVGFLPQHTVNIK